MRYGHGGYSGWRGNGGRGYRHGYGRFGYPFYGAGLYGWPYLYGYGYGYWDPFFWSDTYVPDYSYASGYPYSYSTPYTYSYSPEPQVMVVSNYAYPPQPPPAPVMANEQPPEPPPAVQTTRDYEPTLFLIALNDHNIKPALAYWTENGNLKYVTMDHEIKTVPLSSVDRDLSLRLNHERRVTFSLPRGAVRSTKGA
jgi:hypothetical protein